MAKTSTKFLLEDLPAYVRINAFMVGREIIQAEYIVQLSGEAVIVEARL